MDKINNKLFKYQTKLMNTDNDNKRELYNSKVQQYIRLQDKNYNNTKIMAGGALTEEENPFAAFLSNMSQYKPKEKTDTEINRNVINIQNKMSKTSDLDKLCEAIINYYSELLNEDVFDSFKQELKLLDKNSLEKISKRVNNNIAEKIKEL